MPAPILFVGITMQFAVIMVKWYVISKIRERREKKRLAKLLAETQDDTPEDDDGFIMIPEHLSNQTEIELKEIH